MTSETIHRYTLLVDFLGRTLGPDYEIALHDLERGRPAIVAIANGHISGRDIGAPLTNIAMQIITERYYETHDYRLNYRGETDNGKVLRCSTFFIKNERGALVGLLCINFDDSRYRELSDRVFRLCHPDDYADRNIHIDTIFSPMPEEVGENETFYSSISAATEHALLSVMDGRSVPPERLTQDEKLEVVGLLNQRGIFMLKGAVNDVAEQLACSPASIYRYLSRLNREKRQQPEKP